MKYNRLTFSLSLLLAIGLSSCAVAPKTNNSSNTNASSDVISSQPEDSSVFLGDRIDLFFHVEQRDDIQRVVRIMSERLGKAKTTNYQVEAIDDNTIQVSFNGNQTECDLVTKYLLYDGTASLSNSKGTYSRMSEFLSSDREAYYEVGDDYVNVVIPIDKTNDLFQAVYLEAKEMSDNNTGEVEVEHEDSEGEEEHEHVHKAFLYLWYNFIEDVYTYDKIDQNSPDTYDPMIADDVLMVFDAADPFLDDNNDALRTYIGGDGADLNYAIMLANYFTNIINAGPLGYNVSLLEK